MSWVPLLRSSTGLNNVVDPARLGADENGVTPLAVAYNVTHDPSGRIGRRRGFVQKNADDSHSGFCDGGDCLYASSSSLLRLNKDYSREVLRSDLTTGADLSYVQVAGSIYYANGFQRGIVPQGGSDTAWEAAEYQGPESRKLYHDPPTGHLLAFFDSCILVAKGNVISRSDRFQYGWFRRYAFVEGKRITMMQPVQGGLFVATASKTFFYEGSNIEQMQRKEVADYGVHEGTNKKAPSSLLGLENFGPEVFVWASPQGLCVGANGGFFKNLTETKLKYPAANRGTGIVTEHNYLVLLQE